MQMLLGRGLGNPFYNNPIYIPAELKLHSRQETESGTKRKELEYTCMRVINAMVVFKSQDTLRLHKKLTASKKGNLRIA